MPHEPALQTAFAASHWSLEPQDVRHEVVLAQPLKGAQLFFCSPGHVPLLQFAFCTKVLLVASHLACRQTVVFGHFEQAPLPSHLPSFPQLV